MKKFLKNTALVVTILTGLFGMYKFIFDKPESKPTFITVREVEQILQNDLVSRAPIKILDAAGNEIKSNVYLQKVYFFNQGDKTILPQDVIEPFHFSLEDTSARILDYKITTTSRVVVRPALSIDSSLTRLDFSFSRLEEEDGIEATIIYMASSKTQVVANGYVADMPEGISTSYKWWSFGSWRIAFAVALALIGSNGIMYLLQNEKTDPKPTTKWGRVRASAIYGLANTIARIAIITLIISTIYSIKFFGKFNPKNNAVVPSTLSK